MPNSNIVTLYTFLLVLNKYISDSDSLRNNNVTDGDFVHIYSAIFNCLGVYFIGRGGTGPWAQVRRFRLLRSTTVSRAFGEFEGESDLLTCWRVTDMFQRASVHSIERGSSWYLAMCVFAIDETATLILLRV